MTTKQFTQEDYEALKKAHQQIIEFKEFVMNRFKVFAKVHHGMDVDEHLKTGGGYLSFTVSEVSLFSEDKDTIAIRSFLADDRGGGGITREYFLPRNFLFDGSPDEAEYAEYERLKAKFGDK